jgi:hypothetical protein
MLPNPSIIQVKLKEEVINGETNKGHKDSNEDNLNSKKSEENEDEFILGTPLGTYVLRIIGTKETPVLTL